MEDPRSTPAVKFTSCHLPSRNSAAGDKAKAFSSASAQLGCGAVLHPFHHYSTESENVSYRTPILCIFCGGFLSIHAVINPKTGEWCCPLCRNTNPMFHNLQSHTNSVSKLSPHTELNYDQFLRETYPELQSKHCDYHEILSDLDMTASAFCDKHCPLLRPLHVFALDRSLLHVVTAVDTKTDEISYDDSVIDLLLEGLQQLPSGSKVCIFLYDSAVHLLRLSAIDTDPILAMDTLPGNSNGSGADCNSLLHFSRAGVYYTTVELLLEHAASLRIALCNMSLSRPSSLYDAVHTASASRASSSIYCKCSINTLVQTALAMRGDPVPIANTRGKAKPSTAEASAVPSDKINKKDFSSTRLVFIANRLLPISVSNPIDIRFHNAAALLLGGSAADSTGGTSNDSKLPRLVASYLNVGKYANTNNMSIDVFYRTTHHDYSQVVDKFQALVCPSGGSFIRSETLGDRCVLESFAALLKYNQRPEQLISYAGNGLEEPNQYKYVRDTRASSMATLSVRTSGELSVNQIVGHVQPTDDVIYYRNGATTEESDDRILSASQISVDFDQMVDTLHLLDTQNTPDVFPASHPIRKRMSGYVENQNKEERDEAKFFASRSEAIYYRLMQAQVEASTVTSGVPCTSLQYRPDTMLTITFDYADGEKKFSAAQAVQQLLGVAQMVPSAPSHPSGAASRSDLPLYSSDVSPSAHQPVALGGNVYDSYGTSSAEREAYLDGVFVQFVVHYTQFNLAGGPTAKSAPGISSISSVTRVYTIRVEKTGDFDEYLEGFDETLFGLVTARAIVADYHNACMNSFSGVRKHQLDEQGNYMFASLRESAAAEVDRKVKQVCRLMSSSPKGLAVCRMLHHLKEGPLLDGPSMQPVDAYLLRTLFLNAPYHFDLRVLLPSVKLVSLAQEEPSESGKVKTVPSAVETVTSSSTAAASSAPAAPVPITSLYPPPSSQPPASSSSSSSAAYSRPPLPPSSAPSLMYPPPPTPPPPPPPTAAAGHPMALYLPPSSPHPSVASAPDPRINSTTASVSVSYGPDDSFTSASGKPVVLYSVLPDSMSLLPHTVALIDYGDAIVIKVTSPPDPAEDKPLDDAGPDDLTSILEQLTVIADKIAASRFPAATVYHITSRHSTLDRLVYSRLSPNHMDSMANLLRVYGSDPSAAMRSYLPFFRGLSEADLDQMILRRPITDQLYLAKYLFTVSPTHSAEMVKSLFSSSASASGAVAAGGSRVDSQTVRVTPAVVSTFTPAPTPPVGATMDRELELPISTLEQVDLSSAPPSPAKSRGGQEAEAGNNATVWGDITSIFSSMLPFGGKKPASSGEETVIDFEDKI